MVILCGTFALDEKCAGLLVEAGVPALLIAILKGKFQCVEFMGVATPYLTLSTCTPDPNSAKQEDDEMVLQIVYLFYHLVLHESTRQTVTLQSCKLQAY